MERQRQNPEFRINPENIHPVLFGSHCEKICLQRFRPSKTNYTRDSRQSKTLLTIVERGSKLARNSF